MIPTVSSYSFLQSVRAGRLEQDAIPQKAKDLGFAALEFAALDVGPGEDPRVVARRLRDACDRASIEVVNYAVAADFLRGSGGDWKAEAERLLGELEVAAILGSPRMRHDATQGFPPGHPGPASFDAALPVLAKGCRWVAERAEALGIRTMVENHGYFCQDSDRMERLFCAVDHPNFGLLVDIGNFLCADEAPETAVARVAPYAAHVHAKDFHHRTGSEPDPGRGWFPTRGGNRLRGAILGHGCVPVAQCLGVLRAFGYDGAVSLEFEGLEDPIPALEIGLENLVRFIG